MNDRVDTPTPKTVHLALQGGGAHGAFTWGVLDALLLDGRLQFAGISGTSAGALNAVALAHGWARAQDEGDDPAEGARASLANLWAKVMEMGSLGEGPARLGRLMMGVLPGALTRVSPYLANPLDHNPLRSKAFGVQGTPAFFINGEAYDGDRTFEAFKEKIDPLL